MSSDEFVAFWGRDNLKRWSEPSLRDVAIPQSSKRFLIEVGLPCNQDWTLRFDGQGHALRRMPDKTNLRAIGLDGPVPICLNESLGGCVVAADSGACGQDRFVNSAVEHFGEFLVLYQQYRQKARAESEEDVLDVIAVVEEKMRKIDPDAFGDSNNYWPVIIEQMYQGLL